MYIKRLLTQIPPEETLRRQCLERAEAEFGRTLGPIELVTDAEDARLGLVWQKRARRLALGVLPEGLFVIRSTEPKYGRGEQGPDEEIDGPDDLIDFLRWVAEAPPHGALDYP